MTPVTAPPPQKGMLRMATSVLVLPLKTKGLDGDPKVFGNPKVFPLVPIEDALSKAYGYDAMIAMYQVAEESSCTRINKTGYQYINDMGHSVVAKYVFIDVDNPDHAPWDDPQDIEAAYTFVKSIEICKTAGFYATRHGYRLFWRLKEGIDVKYFESLVTQLIERLAEEGIQADLACTDWTRLFRLPFATPEGANKSLSLPYDFDHGDLEWAPAVLTEGRMQKILEGVTDGWAEQAPPVFMPQPEDIALLKGESDLYNRLKKGQPIAGPGERHKTMMRAIGLLANKLENPTPEAVYKALAYSVQLLEHEPSTKGRAHTPQSLWEACKAMCAVVVSQRRDEKEQTERIVALAVRREQSNHSKETSSRPSLTGDILERSDYAETSGADFIEEGVDPPDDFTDNAYGQVPLRQRCVLFTNSKAYYVFNERTAFYEGPFESTGLPAMIEKYCPNVAQPIRNGKTNAIIATSEILSRFGTEVIRICGTIGKRGIRFDAKNKTIDEGVAAIRRDIRPKFHPEIDKWLRIMGGSHADQLLDWLATFPELQNPTCGLYLKSSGGTGKGLLASGLARLWGAAPTMYQNIIGTHNDGIATCPLVWADEEIPPSQHGKTPSAVFRTLVGNSVFNLRRMYAPPVTLTGSLRLIVTANNNNALKIDEDLSPDDYQAIVERVGYIHVPDAARVYLEQLGGRAATRLWVDGDMIAEHVLWLAKNRPVVRGKRFLVKGWESNMHKHLQVTSGVAGMVVEVIAHAVSKGQIAAAQGGTPPKGFAMGNDHIYVTVRGIVDNWESALGDKSRTASKQRVLGAIRQLTAYSDMVKVDINAGFNVVETVKMWPIRAKEILEAVDQYQLGDSDAIARIVRDNIMRVH